jgi:hypothetical protein
MYADPALFKDPALAALFERDMAVLAGVIASTVFQPRPTFTHGELVAVDDDVFEVVLHKGHDVFVKDAAGKVTSHHEQRVTLL